MVYFRLDMWRFVPSTEDYLDKDILFTKSYTLAELKLYLNKMVDGGPYDAIVGEWHPAVTRLRTDFLTTKIVDLFQGMQWNRNTFDGYGITVTFKELDSNVFPLEDLESVQEASQKSSKEVD